MQKNEALWKSQEEDPMQITMEEVCARARMQETRSARAFRAILCLAALFAVAFIHNLLRFRQPWLITGTAWALVAICYIAWRLLRNGPARRRPAEPCMDFLRRELEAKRQGALGIRWLVVLLSPAILASWWGGGPALRAKTLGVQSAWVLQLLNGPALLIVMALAMAFVWFAFSRQARKIKREMERLGAP